MSLCGGGDDGREGCGLGGLQPTQSTPRVLCVLKSQTFHPNVCTRNNITGLGFVPFLPLV